MLGRGSAAMILDRFDDDLEAVAARPDVLRETAVLRVRCTTVLRQPIHQGPGDATGPANRGL